jgi:glycosyltransferase involved in cell wall biosynthesis
MLRLSPAPGEEAHAPNADGSGLQARVLAVHGVGMVGEAERVLLTAAAAAKPLGWPTLVACPPGDLAAEARRQGLAVRETGLCGLSLLDLRRSAFGAALTLGQLHRSRQEILALAETCGASVLHAHHPVGVLQAACAAQRKGLPLIWHVHETSPMPAAHSLLARRVLDVCSLFICVSKAARAMLDDLGAPRGRVRLVYNAVDPVFLASRPRACAREGGPHVGVFGALEPRKGHADLIRACASLTAVWPGLTLWVVGDESCARATPYRDEMQRLAAEAGLANIRFTGPRADVPDLMTRMDVVVSASVAAESLPTALLEACALGRPVLATDVGGAREIVRDGETGRVVPPGAPERLAAALAEILGGQGPALGERARVSARLRFSPQGFARALADAYRELDVERQAPSTGRRPSSTPLRRRRWSATPAARPNASRIAASAGTTAPFA